MSEQKSWLTRLSESTYVLTCDCYSLQFGKNTQAAGETKVKSFGESEIVQTLKNEMAKKWNSNQTCLMIIYT